MARKIQVCLAVDLGAGSGRALAGVYDGERIALEELARFPNEAVKEADGWHWNFDGLMRCIKDAIALAAGRYGEALRSVGVDSWGVDYGLLGARGELLGAPFQYRDARTQGMQEAAFAKMPRAEIYARTGIQFMFFNTLYQLLAEQRNPARLEKAEQLLFVPDLAHYLLTGVRVNEKTIASTSQLLNPATQEWDWDLIRAMGLPERIFGELRPAGSMLAGLRPELIAETGARDLQVIAPAGHDTAAAVVGAPATEAEPVFLSSGTWSLLGRELGAPVMTEASYDAAFSNEGGAFGTTRFLKNIAGMWLLQESKRAWDAAGHALDYGTLLAAAERAPAFAACVDPNARDFEAPANMPEALAAFCARTGQAAPANLGGTTRMILESLALKYRLVNGAMARVTGRAIDKIYVIGGGCQNRLLNQFTADATGCLVEAGPVEATSLGNIVTQLRALGELSSLAEGRALVRKSFATTRFEPKDTAAWDEAAARFQPILEA